MSTNKYKINIPNYVTSSDESENRRLIDATPYSVMFGYVKRSEENGNQPAVGVNILDDITSFELAEAAYSSLIAAYEFLLANNSADECKAFVRSVKTTINEDDRFDVDSDYFKERLKEVTNKK